MHKFKACLLGLPMLLALAGPASATITYSLRDARFFGETSGRETLESGAFTSSLSEELSVNFSTGGATPTTFDGIATNQAQPFRLGVSNRVSAAADTALTFNNDFVTPTTLVSLVQSQIVETGVVVTGGSGTGYLLPTFGIKGSFDDSHADAFGSVSMCAGANTCVLSGVANSTGPSVVDTTFTPTISIGTDFTFGTPFTFFFFISAGISSFNTGTLTAGEIGVDFTSGLQLLSVSVVDANGDPIPGAVIHSEFLDRLAAPEPATLALLALGLSALMLRRRA